MSVPGASSLHVHAVLLDLGGVIMDVDFHASFSSWARDADVEVACISKRWCDDDAFRAFEVGAIDFGEYLASVTRSLGIELTRAQWRTGWNAVLRGLFDDVVGLLPEVASALPLYGFSNTNPVHREEWEPRFSDALAPFRKIYASCEIGLRKPDVKAYLRVADDMGFAPAHILFVDDSLVNVLGARAAGFDARHVTCPDEVVSILHGLMGER